MLLDTNTSHSKMSRLPHRRFTEASSTPSFSMPEKEVAPARACHPITPIDLRETDKYYVAYLYIDACPEAKLIVTVRDSMLYIRQLNGAPIHDNRQNWNGSFSYGFLLPANANRESVQAYRQEGVLKVEIAKH